MRDTLLQLWRNKYFRRGAWLLSVAVLVLYPLRHVNVGVDLWDGGYNYANFQYGGLMYMDPMWFFATWLSNCAGSLLMRLPFGSYMLGMNIYTGLIVSITASVSYFFCVRRLRMWAPVAFFGVLGAVSLCWLPTSALYCYLTYLFLLIGVCFLYRGLVDNDGRRLVAAGIVLGLNVGNRFSNLVDAGLILAVWAYGLFLRKKLREVLRQTGLCIIGYAAGLAGLLCVISLRYGFGQYAAGIARLFQMTENAVDYKPVNMLTGMLAAYVDPDITYWMKRFLLIFGCCLVVCLFLPGKLEHLKKGLCVTITAAVMWKMARLGFNYGDYALYEAVYAPCVILFEVTGLLALLRILDKNAAGEDRLLAVLLLLILFLTPLGGNNAMYAVLNNTFLTLPGALWLGWRFCVGRKTVLAFPAKCVIFAAVFFALTQCAGFGREFVYEGAVGGRELTAEVEGVPVLAGMHTEARKAEALQGLYVYLEQSRLLGREGILYGYIPGISYYMGLAPAVNIWGDLRSYAPERMAQELEGIAGEIREGIAPPVVILEKRHAAYLETGEEDGLFYDEFARVKLELIGRFLEEAAYRAVYDNEEFVVYAVL